LTINQFADIPRREKNMLERETNLADGPITNINLKLLQTFVLVAEHSSFRAAADDALRSQSAVSTQIKHLEEQLGIGLFHRTTRHVRLTAEGELLLASARRALQDVNACIRQINETADMRRGRVSLACSPTVAATRLAKVLAVFEGDYPTIHIAVSEQNPKELYETVREGKIDFAIGPVARSSEFDFEILYDDPLYAIIPPRFLPKVGKTIALADLVQIPLLLLSQASSLRALIEDALDEANLSVTTKFESSQAQTLLSMTTEGLGACILPKTATPDPRSTSCHVVPITDPPLSRQIALITLKGQSLPPAAQRLVQLCREMLAD
jgi:DNA-binding transcriptional LysR family regulator